ncbi:ATP-binding protein, partial [Verrucosispora sp. SN26_14.1]
VTLLRAEPAVLRRQTGLGAEAARAREILRQVAGLHRPGHPPAR